MAIQELEAHATADQAIAAGVTADIAGSSIAITTQTGSKLFVSCSIATETTSVVGASFQVALVIDGVPDYGVLETFPALTAPGQGSAITRLLFLSTGGAHVVKLQGLSTGGTTNIRAFNFPQREHASCVAVEFK